VCVIYSKDRSERNRGPGRGAGWNEPGGSGIGPVPCVGEVSSGRRNQVDIGYRGGKNGSSGSLVANIGEDPSRRRVLFDSGQNRAETIEAAVSTCSHLYQNSKADIL
jgi:hypothetical protein